jgi:hypothetical protein
MTTGPQHDKATEQLLMMARDARTAARHGDPGDHEARVTTPLAAAQVEAALALAEATAPGGLDPDSRAWAGRPSDRHPLPPWIGVNVASRLPSPPGRLATPSIDDLASLVLQRCWEGLQSGRPAVSVQAAVALIRLAHEIEHDAALAERDAARRQMEESRQEWRHGLWIIRNAIVRQHGEDAWAAISAEVRARRPAAPR